MTAPNVYIDPTKSKGQSMYEQAAGAYVGPDPWPAWLVLAPKERAKWARMEGYAAPSTPTVSEKACKACGITFPLDGFNADCLLRDGRQNTCKVCCRARSRKRYYANHERVLAEHRAYNRDPKYMAARREYAAKARAREPEKTAARNALNIAIKHGKVVRQPCSSCGTSNAQGHHHDYSKPFDVEWLCVTCHGREHRVSPEGLAAP